MVAALIGDELYVLLPSLMRDLTVEQFCREGYKEAKDIISPSGYGGQYCCGIGDKAEAAKLFWRHWEEWAGVENVTCEFGRFSLFPATLIPYWGSVEIKSPNVVRELSSLILTVPADFRYGRDDLDTIHLILSEFAI